MTQPTPSVTLYMLVTEEGSTRRSGTFFCVTKAAVFAPRTAIEVLPLRTDAFIAYSMSKQEQQQC